jgi:hypothetical protein
MLIIGSQAMNQHYPELGIIPNDTDLIGTLDEFRSWSRNFEKGSIALCKPLSGTKMHVRTKDGHNYEFDIASPGDTNQFLLDYFDVHPSGVTFAPPHVLLALKLSHRYRRNSPHFLKTMRDIQFLRGQRVTIGTELEEWMPAREASTYTYAHPKLDVSKDAFFDGDGVPYVYDHDSIHLTQALTERTFMERCAGPSVVGKAVSYGREVTRTYPAYTFYMKDGSEVMTSKEKFMSVPERIRLYGVYEESCVLALERSQIPFPNAKPRQSFEYALMKVCTSITSGWFREFAWENYDKVLDIYEKEGEDGYLKRFNANKHLLKPYEGSTY